MIRTVRRSARLERRKFTGAPTDDCGFLIDRALSQDPVPRCTMPHLWLDLLPAEVCEQIAAFVSTNRLTIDALHLAEVSEKQSAAVLSALDYKFELYALTGTRFGGNIANLTCVEHTARWASVFAGRARIAATDLQGCYTDEEHDFTNAVCAMLRSESLRTAAIPEDVAYLRALGMSRSVRDLSVSFGFAGGSHQTVLDVLDMLDLDRLELKCSDDFCSGCSIKSLLSTSGRDCLSERCPSVRSLSIRCLHLQAYGIWPIIAGFTSLRELVLLSTLPDEALPMLRSLPSVTIIPWGINGFRFASKIGNSVKRLNNDFGGFLYRDVLEVLEMCPGLTHLSLSMHHGDTTQFAPILARMSMLKSVELNWPYCTVLGDSHDRAHVESAPGAILEVACAVDSLEEFSLTNVRIRLSELSAVLETIGGRLKHFATSIYMQEEPACKRLAMVLESLATFNRSLCTFHIADLPRKSGLFPRREQKIWRQRLHKGQSQLRRASSMLSIASVADLEFHVNAICELSDKSMKARRKRRRQ